MANNPGLYLYNKKYTQVKKVYIYKKGDTTYHNPPPVEESDYYTEEI